MAPFHRPSKTCTAISRTWRKSAGSRSGGFSSPPLLCSLSFAPFVFRSRPRNGNGRLSVGAHCVQITTNHLFLWIVPRSAGSRIVPLLLPPLVNSSFRFRASIIKEGESKGKERRGSDYSTCSLRFIAGQPRVCPPSICLSRGGPLLSPRSVAEDNDDVIGFGSENSNSFTICFSK